MGVGKSKNAIFLQSLELFSVDEQKNITAIYKKICGKNNDGFSETDLMQYGSEFLVEAILVKLFHFMKSVIVHEPGDHTNDLLVDEEEFLVSLAYLLKSTPDQRAETVFFLSTGQKDGTVSASDIKQFTVNLIESFVKCQGADSPLRSWVFAEDKYANTLLRLLLHDLVYKDKQRQHAVKEEFPWESAHTFDSMEKWLNQTALILKLLDGVFHKIFTTSAVDAMIHMSHHHVVPYCQNAPWDKLSTLLDQSSLLFLNHNLPSDLQTQWRFLFSTNIHGESFSTMMKNITDKGSTVILIEDTNGHVFGGFASSSWTSTSHFIGSPQCFLFSLAPVMDIYRTTGYNENYQYVNHGQETIPNGLGMGGQFGYFGLWLDYEFGQGHSKAEPQCTTYGSPRLSKNEDFDIKTVEVWGVGPEPKKDQEGAEGHGSILDKDPEAKAMLTMINKGPVSEGLREEDPVAAIPEEHSLAP